MTDRVRVIVVGVFCLTIIVALIGWFLSKDIAPLSILLTPEVAALGIGEASNVGKRWTTRPDMGPPEGSNAQ